MHSVTIFDAIAREWLHVEDPIGVLTCSRVEQAVPLLSRLAHRVDTEGSYAAGFLACDAAAGMDAAMTVRDDEGLQR